MTNPRAWWLLFHVRAPSGLAQHPARRNFFKRHRHCRPAIHHQVGTRRCHPVGKPVGCISWVNATASLCNPSSASEAASDVVCLCRAPFSFLAAALLPVPSPSVSGKLSVALADHPMELLVMLVVARCLRGAVLPTVLRGRAPLQLLDRGATTEAAAIVC